MKKATVNKKRNLLTVALISLLMLVAPSKSYASDMYVSGGNGVNFRDYPSEDSYAERIPYGTALTFLDESEDGCWSKVKFGDRIGWVYNDYVSWGSCSSSNSYVEYEPEDDYDCDSNYNCNYYDDEDYYLYSNSVIMVSSGVNIRSSANATIDNVVGWLDAGERVVVIGERSDGCMYCILYDGVKRFVWADYLTSVSDSDDELGTYKSGCEYSTANRESGSYSVNVYLDEQEMDLMRGNSTELTTSVVTGTKGSSETVPGEYSINCKEENTHLTGYNKEGKYYDRFVNFWMPFDGGKGIHDATWRDYFGGDIYEYAGSLGCVNTPFDAVKTFFEKLNVGDEVRVFQNRAAK